MSYDEWDGVTNVIISNWKAPKGGLNYGRIQGTKYCKGICHRIEQNPPWGKPKYNFHAFCSRCNVWMNKNVLNKKGRCPCCNCRARQKPFKQ